MQVPGGSRVLRLPPHSREFLCRLTLDLFQLKPKSELGFDGDAGVTAPNGPTTRRGIELSSHYQVTS
jgi:hypothetical protein